MILYMRLHFISSKLHECNIVQDQQVETKVVDDDDGGVFVCVCVRKRERERERERER